MKFFLQRFSCKGLFVLTCSLLLGLSDLIAQTFQQGDVFVAVGDGQVQWRRANGTLVQTLNTGQGGYTTGMAFDASGKLYVTNFSANSVSVFNTNGTLQGTFGGGYSTPESIVFDQAGNVYVGNLGNGIRKYNAAGTFLSTVYSGRTDFFDIAADQCTALITTESSFIGRHNICTNTALSNFASGLGGSAYALRIRQNGEVLVANGINIRRLSATGAPLQSYGVSGENSWFALNLNPDGTSFWSANINTSNVYKIDIATGNVLQSFNTGTTPGNTVFGLAVFGEFTVSVCADNIAPAFSAPSPTCGSTLTATAGSPFSFTVNATDANSGDAINLTATGVPSGATFTPALPTSGNPVSTTFNWTPTGADVGTYTVTFTAQDKCVQTTCTYTVNVVAGGSGNIYYSKAAGDLHNVLTWGINPDGSGTNPTDFGAAKYFQLANRLGVYTMTGNWVVGGILNIPTSSQLQINGFSLSLTDKEGPGTISGSMTSNLSIIGTEGGNIGLSFTPMANMLNNFTVNRSGTGSMATLNNALEVYNVLTLTTGTLNTGGMLTLKSTAANTARVAPVSGAIMGDVTVERYIPARRAWRILSAPVGGITDAAIGQATLTHSQETVQGPFLTSGGAPRPQSYGTATFSLNAGRTAMTFTATVYNIDVTGSQTPGDNNDNLTAAHIHVGAPPGANAPVRWGFIGTPDNDVNPKNTTITPFASGVGGTITGTWDLPEGNAGTTLATNLPEILAFRSYVNFHTTQFGGGEIRGQIRLVGATTQTVNQAWQEGTILGFSANPNPFPGYGTHITGGPLWGTIANGFDQNPVGAESSLKEYIRNVWTPHPNTNATPVGGRAWMTFVRGNRALPIGYNDVPPSSTTLRAKGPLYVGDQTFQVEPSGFTAIPNPFASPIDFATLTRNGVQNNFYLWDPKLGGANGVGGYVLLSYNGTSYDITPAPVSPESQYIQSGQGFLVRPSVVGTPGTVTIKESDKSATPAMDVFRVAGGPQIRQENLRITLRKSADDESATPLDEVMLSYSSNYADKIDIMDAPKPPNVNENLAILRNDETFMIERRAVMQEGDIIDLKLWNTLPQEYSFVFTPSNLNIGTLQAFLEDKYLKTSTPIDLNQVTVVRFTISSQAASARSDRFRIVFGLKNKIEKAEKFFVNAYPNPLSGNTLNLVLGNYEKGTYQIELLNGSGQVVFRKSIQHRGGTNTESIMLGRKHPAGTYQVRVNGDGKSTTTPIVIN